MFLSNGTMEQWSNIYSSYINSSLVENFLFFSTDHYYHYTTNHPANQQPIDINISQNQTGPKQFQNAEDNKSGQ
jgi:hypothetical protein